MIEEGKELGELILLEAAKHLEAALELLDSAAVPGHIAAHVDLGAQQLQELIRAYGEAKLEDRHCSVRPTTLPDNVKLQ